MTLNKRNDLVLKIQSSLGPSSELLEPTEFEFAANQALAELGWKYPITDLRKEYWCIQRGKRHALDLLRIVSAHRFKYKQISLNHRFDHYDRMIQSMDDQFEKARKTDPVLAEAEFDAGVFGVYIANNFIYDQTGNDVTKLLYENSIDNKGYRYRYIQ